MPLDPFFEDRLRQQREFLIKTAKTTARERLTALWPFGRSASPATTTPPPTSPALSSRDAATHGPRARARAKHRRQALTWDRKELEKSGTPGPDIPTSEHVVAVPGYPDVRVRVYRPAESDHVALPAAVVFFGGAFRLGGIDFPTVDAGCRRRAVDAGIVIVAVDYALAPEHRFPTQVEQSHAALEWTFANAAALNIDVERIGILGTSAGGNIAAAVTLLNRDRGALKLKLQVLEVPVTDLTGKHLDFGVTRALGIPNLLARRELRSVVRTYLPHSRDARNPLASPLLADSHAGLPPAVLFTAEFDPLRADGAAYAAALRRSGVDASAVQYLGVTHDTGIFTGVLPAARRWHDDVVTALRRLHD